MKKFIIGSLVLVSILALARDAYSEVIYGDAVLRAPDGSEMEICSLKEGTYVEVFYTESRNYRATLAFKISSAQHADGKMKQGDMVIAEGDKIVGYFLNDYDISSIEDYKLWSYNDDNYWSSSLSGFVNFSELEYVLEDKLRSLIGEGKHELGDYVKIIEFDRFQSVEQMEVEEDVYMMFMKYDTEWSPVSPISEYFLNFKNDKLYSYYMNESYREVGGLRDAEIDDQDEGHCQYEALIQAEKAASN